MIKIISLKKGGARSLRIRSIDDPNFVVLLYLIEDYARNGLSWRADMNNASELEMVCLRHAERIVSMSQVCSIRRLLEHLSV